MSLHFLSLSDVLEIHTDQINRYGGSLGIRDKNLLLSAIAQPYATFDRKYLHNTIYDKASAYLFHICQNHPFIDGNKRVALTSSLMFLGMNGYSIDYKNIDLENLTLSVAQGKNAKEEISSFLRMGVGIKDNKLLLN